MKFFGVTLFEKRVIGDGTPMLTRYILFRVPSFGIFLHHMHRSDHDRALHDHPWPFVSVVLRGGYREIHDQTLDGSQVSLYHRPGSVLVRPAEWRHRFALYLNLDTEPDTEAWTLVFVGRRSRRWGFFTPQGWCWWRKYNYRNGICEENVLWTNGKD